ncbi:sugar phosphate isomerase/epimerase family protein [Acidicapsa ligni]|uniref:sugar phosphate isomerase/epimerase family protein n=1 Tax=Acidicapsa ligni TaxID=542300 RepID=UPI0021DFB164|nr:sugar phosphate isomerase/epimerase family protein [Acidicapsa ligni]
MSSVSRRGFLHAAGATGAAVLAYGLSPAMLQAAVANSPFRIAVISDEISPDFDHACSVIANDFGLQWVELRSLWTKNIMDLSDEEIARANAILDKYKLRVTDIASPLFKTDWPGAPRSKFSPKNDSFGASFGFKQQDEVLEKTIALARKFKTERIRCFDFWRLDDQAPYRAAINAKLAEAANIVGKQGLLLVLENEFECNTATGRESVKTLAAVRTPHLMLNWDPGNAVARGELDAFPTAFNLLPKNRIGHCHVKCAVAQPTPAHPDGFEWAAVGQGIPDWVAQFRALKQSGYRQAVSLETHWGGAGSPEASTRISWAGMKDALQKSGNLS